MTRRLTTLFAATALMGLIGAAPGDALAKRKKGPPAAVSAALAQAPSNRQAAITMLEDALAGRKPDKDTPVLMLHAGEQRRLAGDLAEARAWFDRVIQLGPDSPHNATARLGRALVMASEGDLNDRVLNAFRDISERQGLDTQNADRYLFLALEAAKRGESGKVSSYSKRAREAASADSEVLRRVQSSLDTIVQLEPEQVTSDVVEGARGPLEKALAAYSKGDVEVARRLAEKAANHSDADIAAGGRGLLRTLDAPLDRGTIGLLLPTSDKYAAVGERIANAFRLGYGNAPIRIKIYDTGSTPETAVQALEQAVLEDGVVAVVGPLLSVNTEPVVQAAEMLAVPLVSLSQSFEDPEDGMWGFQAMYTRGDQVDALLEWSMEMEGMGAFAVFGPDSEFGTRAAEMFQEGVLARGGTVTAVATYPDEEPDLRSFAAEFGTREGDETELRRLQALAKSKGRNPGTVVLPPLVDFDAIFVPEDARRTPIATAALAYAEFPMGDFQPRRGEQKVPLLGMATWNVEGLVATGNQYTRKSRFPDVFSSTLFAEDDPTLVMFKDALGKTPGALEVAIYDAGQLVAAAAQQQPAHRGAFRQALLDARVSDSITGATSFDPESQHASRNMLILTLTRNTIRQLGEVTLHGAEPRDYPDLYQDGLFPKDDETPQEQ